MKTSDATRIELMVYLRALLPTCEDSARLQSEALDRRLSRLERLGLRLHLLICKLCRNYSRQLRLLRKTLSNPASRELVEPQVSLSKDTRQRMVDLLRKEAGAS